MILGSIIYEACFSIFYFTLKKIDTFATEFTICSSFTNFIFLSFKNLCCHFFSITKCCGLKVLKYAIFVQSHGIVIKFSANELNKLITKSTVSSIYNNLLYTLKCVKYVQPNRKWASESSKIYFWNKYPIVMEQRWRVLLPSSKRYKNIETSNKNQPTIHE